MKYLLLDVEQCSVNSINHLDLKYPHNKVLAPKKEPNPM